MNAFQKLTDKFFQYIFTFPLILGVFAMRKMICVFLFSYCLGFTSAEISDDLVLAMQKASNNKKAESADGCEKHLKKDDMEKRVCELERCAAAKTPHFSRCDCTDGCGFFIVTDFLYWLVKNERGFYFGNSSFGETFDTKIKAPKNNYKPGVRFGLGYNLPHDNWDIYLDWTWIKSTAFKAKRAKDYRQVGGITYSDCNIAINENPLNDAFSLVPVDFVKIKSGVKYNSWDFEIGRIFYPGNYFSLRPFMGLRGIFIKQVFERYATSPLAVNGQDVFPLSEKVHEKFWGIGLRPGIMSELNFCKSFGLYGIFSMALLYSQLDVATFTVTDIDKVGEYPYRISRKFDEIKPAFQAALGFSYNKCFCHSILLGLKAGYEINYYWDCANIYDISLLQKVNRALELSGLTLGMRLEF